MKGRRVSLIVFYNQEGKILLQDRRGIAKRGEHWGYFGGGIEAGESPEQALVREVEEELGYKLEDFEYFGRLKNTLPDGYTIDRYVFTSPLGKKTESFALKEGRGMKLFSLDEAEKLIMIPGDELIIAKLKGFLKNG